MIECYLPSHSILSQDPRANTGLRANILGWWPLVVRRIKPLVPTVWWLSPGRTLGWITGTGLLGGPIMEHPTVIVK